MRMPRSVSSETSRSRTKFIRSRYACTVTRVGTAVSGVSFSSSSSITFCKMSTSTFERGEAPSLSSAGASSGTTKFAMSNVSTITPDARKMSRSRLGNGVVAATKYGSDITTESVTAPFGPASVITAALRRKSALIFGRAPSRLRVSFSIITTHAKRTPSTMAVMSTIRTRSHAPP